MSLHRRAVPMLDMTSEPVRRRSTAYKTLAELIDPTSVEQRPWPRSLIREVNTQWIIDSSFLKRDNQTRGELDAVDAAT